MKSRFKSLLGVHAGRVIGCAIVTVGLILASQRAVAAGPPRVEKDGTTHVPAFLLPESFLLDEKTRTVLRGIREDRRTAEAGRKGCPADKSSDPANIPGIRRCQAEEFAQFAAQFRDDQDVVMVARQIGGVYTEIFTPKDGVAAENKHRVLIDLHGGHFMFGSRVISNYESIPIASVGKFKVVSVDYRMAPEHAFPAASEDVAAVYRELLKSYKPQNIGIFGCSAGGLLTAESIAWFQKEALPIPAAIGMFGGGASYYQDGDSGVFASAREGFELEPPSRHPYFKATRADDPLAFPIRSTQILAKFPPSLLIASTRDVGMSSVVHTHSQLIRLGVKAELHVWEGLEHCFFPNMNLPQSHEVYDVVTRFFDRHLGK